MIQVDDPGISTKSKSLITETVTGFLDFVTTISDTVLIFTPQLSKGLQKDFSHNLMHKVIFIFISSFNTYIIQYS